jgi:hypothetical protein
MFDYRRASIFLRDCRIKLDFRCLLEPWLEHPAQDFMFRASVLALCENSRTQRLQVDSIKPN